MSAPRATPSSLVPLLVGVSVKLGFGIAFYFVAREESFGGALVGLAVLTLAATADIVEHVRTRRQRARFGELPLRLETAIPRLGVELSGSFEVTLEPSELKEAWVSLTCSLVQPAKGDDERYETERFTQRSAGTVLPAERGCAVAFAFLIPASLPRSTYTPGMLIRDQSVEFDEWRVSLELSTRRGQRATTSTAITVYA